MSPALVGALDQAHQVAVGPLRYRSRRDLRRLISLWPADAGSRENLGRPKARINQAQRTSYIVEVAGTPTQMPWLRTRFLGSRAAQLAGGVYVEGVAGFRSAAVFT